VGVFEPPLSIKGRYALTQDNIVKFAEPGAFEDPLTEVLRCGARKLLAGAIEAEVSDFLDRHSRFLTEEGQQRLVRHGHLPEREIMTGIGPVGVRASRVRDRVGQGEARPLLVGDSAALCAPIEEPRGVDPDPLPEGHIHGQLRGAGLSLPKLQLFISLGLSDVAESSALSA
jgi:hypothetical protein